jgi:protein-tyrosine-phosphatase
MYDLLEAVCYGNNGRSKPFEIVFNAIAQKEGLGDVVRAISSGVDVADLRKRHDLRARILLEKQLRNCALKKFGFSEDWDRPVQTTGRHDVSLVLAANDAVYEKVNALYEGMPADRDTFSGYSGIEIPKLKLFGHNCQDDYDKLIEIFRDCIVPETIQRYIEENDSV